MIGFSFFLVIYCKPRETKKMAGSLSIDNCLIQVRSCLQEEGIKLWLEPYYVQGIGPVDLELEVNYFDTL